MFRSVCTLGIRHDKKETSIPVDTIPSAALMAKKHPDFKEGINMEKDIVADMDKGTLSYRSKVVATYQFNLSTRIFTATLIAEAVPLGVNVSNPISASSLSALQLEIFYIITNAEALIAFRKSKESKDEAYRLADDAKDAMKRHQDKILNGKNRDEIIDEEQKRKLDFIERSLEALEEAASENPNVPDNSLKTEPKKIKLV